MTRAIRMLAVASAAAADREERRIARRPVVGEPERGRERRRRVRVGGRTLPAPALQFREDAG
jgi:hypothetical protein